MDLKIAGILSLAGFVAILVIWSVLVLVAQPVGTGELGAVKQLVSYVFSPSTAESWFFTNSFISAVVCIISAALFFWGRAKVAVGVVASHTAVALFIYTWVLPITIGLPLLLVKRVWKNA